MCLAVLALGVSERFPLVVAANRDEYHDRLTGAMEWWTPAGSASPILAGRDLQAGGTWMGLDACGRLAFLTNVRDPRSHDPGAVSRGGIVPAWLAGRTAGDVLDEAIDSGVNGFNLVALDMAAAEAFHVTNRPARLQRLPTGIAGLSNAGFDAPWPKVLALKARAQDALATCTDADRLMDELLHALLDDARAPDALLPSTGVSLEWERQLSSIFIRSDDRRYGTRSSTVVVLERASGRNTARIVERSYDRQGGISGVQRFRLGDWPAMSASRPLPRAG
jgi:uncharacterized protein with NRDE domain